MKACVWLLVLLLPMIACSTASPTRQSSMVQTQQTPLEAAQGSSTTMGLEAMSAEALAQMLEDDPTTAMDLLWDGVDLVDSTDVIRWCLHQISEPDPELCRQFARGHAETLLDIADFGGPETLLDYFQLDEEQPMSGLDLARSLLPHLKAQYAGGFANKLGRVLHKHRVRATMRERHGRLQAAHRSVQSWVRERPPVMIPETGEAVVRLLIDDPSAFSALVFAAGSATDLQKLLDGLSSEDIPAARNRLAEEAKRVLSIRSDVDQLLGKAPAADAESVLNWLIRNMAVAAGRADGSLQSELGD